MNTAAHNLENVAEAELKAPIRTNMAKLLHGRGALDGLPDELRELGVERVIVLTGPNAAKGATLKRAANVLGSACVGIYSGCLPHTPIETVHELVALANSTDAQAFVSIGGGSTVDTAKVAAAILGEGQPAEELTTEFRPPDTYVERWLRKTKPPIIAVPSTLSGAETGPRAGFISTDKIKRIVGGDYLAARLLILDPEATLDVDIDVFLRSGLNGLAHAIEGIYSRRRNPIAEAYAAQAIALFTRNLPLARSSPDDLDVRMNLLYAGYLGGMTLLSSRMGIHHAVCHCLGGRLGLSHGTVNSIMLPYSMAFNLDAATPALARAAIAMGIERNGMDERTLAQAGINRIHEVKAQIGVPARLRDLTPTPTEADLDAVADDVKIERGLFFNPRRVRSRESIAEFIRSAY